MKNLKTLLFPLLFGFSICNGLHSQAQELLYYKNKEVEYHEKHIKAQIKSCYSEPDYNTCDEKTDSVFFLNFTLVECSRRISFCCSCF